MFDIYILDSYKDFSDRCGGHAKKAVKEQGYSVGKVYSTTDLAELVQQCNFQKDNDLFFIDVEFSSPKMSGIQIAQRIRNLSPPCSIVPVVHHAEPEYLCELIETRIQPFGYVLRGDLKNEYVRIQECIAAMEDKETFLVKEVYYD